LTSSDPTFLASAARLPGESKIPTRPLTPEEEECINARIFLVEDAHALQREWARLPNAPAAIPEPLIARIPFLAARLFSPHPDGTRSLGEAARSRGCIVAPRGHGEGDVLIAGPLSCLEEMASRLIEEEGHGQTIGGALEAALAGLRTHPDHLDLGDRTLSLAAPVLMGIVNVTPDSFSDGGHFLDPALAEDHARALALAGAGILDIGGESTRPGAPAIDEAEECRRVLPVLERLADVPVVLSIDTSKAMVAREAIDRGARLVNDVSGLRGDPLLAEVVAEKGCGLLVMHMRGTPRTMQVRPHYDDLLGEVMRELRSSVRLALAKGVKRSALVIDPGFGFAKTTQHNLELLDRLHELSCLGLPLAIGTSRKSTLGFLTGRPPDERMIATAATTAMAVLRRALILRVHDVEAMRDAVAVARATASTRVSPREETPPEASR
jgi:dihydropteroate synthase